jgi:hypothetical protein
MSAPILLGLLLYSRYCESQSDIILSQTSLKPLKHEMMNLN